MTKVLAFGTFDIFHKGHEYFLKKAKKLGDELHVVIARDATVLQIKKEKPHNSENFRQETVQKQEYITKAHLGNLDDKYKIIEDIKPDIICLGYDQIAFTNKLSEELLGRNITCKIIRMPSFKPDIYKSSLIKKNSPKA
ncbi:MAG: adenylyltransferase/cytidyltransferase family protein [Candidatus Woesearchaeota archaeon]